MNEEKLNELEKEVIYLRGLCEALLRVQWNARAEMKGEVGKIEKELDSFFQDWLKRSKIEPSRKVINENSSQRTAV